MNATSPQYLTAAETAKLIRKALKANFPGVKFSVRSDTYSGGASCRVAWVDGPLARDVDAVVGRFAGATFDGMRDLKEYHTTLLAGPDGTPREVRFGADFVFTDRVASAAEHLAAAQRVAAYWGLDMAALGAQRTHGSFRFRGVTVHGGFAHDPMATSMGNEHAPREWFSTLVHRELATADILNRQEG